VLFLAGLCVVPAAVLTAEGALALFGGGGTDFEASSSIDSLHRYSEVYGWEPRPGRYVEAGRATTINDAGYRGPRLSTPAPANRTRVVVLGDSIAFGLYVDDRETYAAVLAARASDLEVANLAVQGYDPGQSLLRLEGVGLALEPDVVVLGLCLGNDFADAMLQTFLYDAAHPKPYFSQHAGRLVIHDEHLELDTRERVSLWLQDHSRLFRALQSGREAGREPATPWTQRRGLAMRDRGAALDLVARLVIEMRDRTEFHGARFVVLLHPDRVASARAAETWERALAERLRAAGVEALSLADAYAGRGLEYEQVALDSIGHLSASGHAVTAAILQERLESRLTRSRNAALTDTASRLLR
jgi:GDSL-like Lipase/Acylhydrolase family